MSSLFSLFYILIGEKGVSCVLFSFLQALMTMQVMFICSLEHIFHNTRANIEKSVISSLLLFRLPSFFCSPFPYKSKSISQISVTIFFFLMIEKKTGWKKKQMLYSLEEHSVVLYNSIKKQHF